MNPGAIFHTNRGITFALAALIALAALVALAQPFPVSAQAVTTPEEISGRIVNGTEGSEVPVGTIARLFTVDETTQSVVANDETVVGTNGEFTFSGYPVGDNITYRVVADNDTRHTPSVDLKAGRDEFENVEITIWDVTTSLDDISVPLYQILVPAIDGSERLIGVLAVANISNSSDKVWIADVDSPALTGLDLLRFNLPEGYQELSVESDLPFGNVLEIGTGFAITNPVPPGNYQILMTYVAPYEGDALDFPLRLPYGADELRILTPDDGVSVTGLGLGAPEGVVIDTEAYTAVKGFDYPRDSQLDVRFESLPTPTTIENLQSFFDSNTYIFVVMWIVVALILAILVYAFFYARKTGRKVASAPAGGAVTEYAEYTDLTRSEIVTAIAELDEKHDAGEIDGKEYQSRREALKHAALAAGKSGKK